MLSRISVKKPYTVLVGVVLIIVLGVVSVTRMTADLLPPISLPYVMVMTTYPGAGPEAVESDVTRPIESSMATVSNIKNISSASSKNYSTVTLEFEQNANMDSVSLEIREKLDQVEGSWDSDKIGKPLVMKLSADMLPVMVAAVQVDGKDSAEASLYVKQDIIPSVESVEGVASVGADGIITESVNVVISEDKIAATNALIAASIDKQTDSAVAEIESARPAIMDGWIALSEGQAAIATNTAMLQDATNDFYTRESTTVATFNAGLQGISDNLERLADFNDEAAGIQKLSDDLAGFGDILEVDYGTLFAAINDVMRIMQKEYWSGVGSFPELKDSPYAGTLTPIIGAIAGIDASTIEKVNRILEGILNPPGSTQPPASFTKEDLDKLVSALNSLQKVLDKIPSESEIAEIGAWLQKLQSQIEAAMKLLDASSQTLQSSLVSIETALGHDIESLKLVKADMDAVMTLLNADISLLQTLISQIDGLVGQIQPLIALYVESQALDQAAAQLKAAARKVNAADAELTEAQSQLDDAVSQVTQGAESAKEASDVSQYVTAQMVSQILTAQDFSMPAGYVSDGQYSSYMVRVGDRPEDADEMTAMPVMDLKMDGVPVITLADVADVFYVDDSDEVYANVNGSPGVLLTIQKQSGYSSGDVSDRVQQRFTEIHDEDAAVKLIPLMDQGVYIDLVIRAILRSVLLGAILAILVLLLFLRDLRPTVIVAISIPVSLVAAIVCMYFTGVTLNIISLAGLALGVGMLVDNSIVVIENIFRLRHQGVSAGEAAIQGAKEVTGAIIASTLTTVCVFLPIVFTEGLTRQLFADLALTIGFALLASLVIALTVVPAMAGRMGERKHLIENEELVVRKSRKPHKHFFDMVVSAYGRALTVALKYKPAVIVIAVGMLALSAYLGLKNGTAFMPDMDSTQFTVNVRLPDGATFADTRAVTDEAVSRIGRVADIADVGAIESGTTSSGKTVHSSTIYVTTDEDKKRSNDDIAEELTEKLADVGGEVTVDTSSMDMSALGGSGITIRVQGGNDIAKLLDTADLVKTKLSDCEGVTNARVSASMDTELHIAVDKAAAMQYNLTVAQVYMQVSQKLAQTDMTKAQVAVSSKDGSQDVSIYIVDDTKSAATINALENLEITPGESAASQAPALSGGIDAQMLKLSGMDIASLEPVEADADADTDDVPGPVYLKQIAEITLDRTLSTINREAQNRYVSVKADIADGYNVGIVSGAVKSDLAKMELPAGIKLVYDGENETINEALRQILLMLVLALVFMYLIMVAQFQSLLSPFIVMFTVPLAFTGGLFAMAMTGSELSVVALLGFVMLSGVIVNNGIVLIDCANRARDDGMDKREALVYAGQTRLRPVLMTAATTIFAMLDLVLAKSMGSEMMRPMALVSVGGLLYGTLLTLFVVPCVYDMFVRVRKK